jgi:uncharacterized iron-regulated protein
VIRRRTLYLLLAAFALGVLAHFMVGDGLSMAALDLAEQRLLRLSDRSTLRFAEIIEEVRGVPLLFVGELHDQPAHHWAQLQVIRALHEAEVPAAVGIEMFRAADQETLDAWVRGEIPEEEFVPVFLDNWGPPWSLYAGIFLYCREHEIPMIGLNLPRAIPRRVSQEGFGSLPPEQRRELPSVKCDVDEVYEQFLRGSMEMAAKGELEYDHYCEAQLLWDSVMASHVLRFLENHPDTTLVVLAGTGHAWKRGIPARVQRRSASPLRVILPELADHTRTNASVEDTDYLWLELPISP